MRMNAILEKTDDDAFTGRVASLDFDVNVTILPNAAKKEGTNAPDYRVVGKSPRGMDIEIGAGWNKISQAKKPYVSVTADFGMGEMNLNLVERQDGTFTLLPYADR